MSPIQLLERAALAAFVALFAAGCASETTEEEGDRSESAQSPQPAYTLYVIKPYFHPDDQRRIYDGLRSTGTLIAEHYVDTRVGESGLGVGCDKRINGLFNPNGFTEVRCSVLLPYFFPTPINARGDLEIHALRDVRFSGAVAAKIYDGMEGSGATRTAGLFSCTRTVESTQCAIGPDANGNVPANIYSLESLIAEGKISKAQADAFVRDNK